MPLRAPELWVPSELSPHTTVTNIALKLQAILQNSLSLTTTVTTSSDAGPVCPRSRPFHPGQAEVQRLCLKSMPSMLVSDICTCLHVQGVVRFVGVVMLCMVMNCIVCCSVPRMMQNVYCAFCTDESSDSLLSLRVLYCQSIAQGAEFVPRVPQMFQATASEVRQLLPGWVKFFVV